LPPRTVNLPRGMATDLAPSPRALPVVMVTAFTRPSDLRLMLSTMPILMPSRENAGIPTRMAVPRRRAEVLHVAARGAGGLVALGAAGLACAMTGPSGAPSASPTASTTPSRSGVAPRKACARSRNRGTALARRAARGQDRPAQPRHWQARPTLSMRRSERCTRSSLRQHGSPTPGTRVRFPGARETRCVARRFGNRAPHRAAPGPPRGRQERGRQAGSGGPVLLLGGGRDQSCAPIRTRQLARGRLDLGSDLAVEIDAID